VKLARGTPSWVASATLLALAALALSVLVAPIWWAAAIPLGAVAGLLLNFFRDPERAPAPGIVSPADGVVTTVTEHAGRRRVNIFMNPLDVHVNRAPLDGTVLSVERVRGGFVPAFKKESERNERVVIEWETALGPVTTVQIAGTVARRIVPYVKTGDRLAKGERIGIIRLGSRVDVYLPATARVVVREGERVKAGATTLALPPEATA